MDTGELAPARLAERLAPIRRREQRQGVPGEGAHVGPVLVRRLEHQILAGEADEAIEAVGKARGQGGDARIGGQRLEQAPTPYDAVGIDRRGGLDQLRQVSEQALRGLLGEGLLAVGIVAFGLVEAPQALRPDGGGAVIVAGAMQSGGERTPELGPVRLGLDHRPPMGGVRIDPRVGWH